MEGEGSGSGPSDFVSSSSSQGCESESDDILAEICWGVEKRRLRAWIRLESFSTRKTGVAELSRRENWLHLPDAGCFLGEASSL